METLMNTVIRVDHLLSVKQYADAARMQTRSVHLRHRRGVICAVHLDGLLVVDALQSPPSVKLPYGAGKAPKFHWPAELPPPDKLLRVKNLCERYSIRGHDLYLDIILGKIKAWYIAEQLYVEDGPDIKPHISRGRKLYKRQLRS